MIDLKIFKQSLGYSVGVVLYIAVVATLLQNAQRIFGALPVGILAPVSLLLLLVTSVATMGMLIFGKPVMLYLDGKKREAVNMVGCTIGCLAAFTLILLAIMAVMQA